MIVYDEKGNILESYDLTTGYLSHTTRTEHHEAIEGVEEQGHYEVLRTYPNGGKDVEWVIDIPGVKAEPAWDEEIFIKVYHPYTQDELDAIEAEKEKPTMEQRLAVLEKENAYLKETLEIILSGDTGEVAADG